MFQLTNHRTAKFIRALAVIVALLTSGCASTGGQVERHKQQDVQIDGILGLFEQGESHPEARRCLSTHSHRDVEVLDGRHLLFTGHHRQQWLNRIGSRCPSLKRHSTLAFKLHTSQICHLDSFKVLDFWQWPRYRRWPWSWWQGVSCPLGKFIPVTDAQAEAIRQVLKD